MARKKKAHVKNVKAITSARISTGQNQPGINRLFLLPPELRLEIYKLVTQDADTIVTNDASYGGSVVSAYRPQSLAGEKLIFIKNNREISLQTSAQPIEPYYLRRPEPLRNLSILATCKTILSEAAPLCLSSITIDISAFPIDHIQYSFRKLQECAKNSPIVMTHVKNVRIIADAGRAEDFRMRELIDKVFPNLKSLVLMCSTYDIDGNLARTQLLRQLFALDWQKAEIVTCFLSLKDTRGLLSSPYDVTDHMIQLKKQIERLRSCSANQKAMKGS